MMETFKLISDFLSWGGLLYIVIINMLYCSAAGALFHELSRTLYDSDTTIYMCVRERLQMRVNCLCIGFTDDSDWVKPCVYGIWLGDISVLRWLRLSLHESLDSFTLLQDMDTWGCVQLNGSSFLSGSWLWHTNSSISYKRRWYAWTSYTDGEEPFWSIYLFSISPVRNKHHLYRD